MKITSPGNDTTTYRFHCKCGCVYEVAEWELQHASENTFPRYRYTRCPRCGKEMMTYEAERVNSTDTFAETISESESKSEPAENHCKDCAYLGTRKDSSKFCMIPGKTPSTETCDRYKSIEADIAERAERTKLKEAAQFIHTYCTNHHNCKGCPFDGGIAESCELVQIPKDWNTDFLE